MGMWLERTMVLLYIMVLCIGAFANTDPEGIHIALAGKDAGGHSNSMSVAWTTRTATKTTTVKYGLSKDKLIEVATGKSWSRWGDYNHVVVLPTLQPATLYYYVCGDAEGGLSPVLQFTTAPSKDDTLFKMVILGDMGTTRSEETLALMKDLTPKHDLFLHVGDVGYADDAVLVRSTFATVWRKYMNMMQPIMSSKPYMVLPGNHEAECHDLSCVLYLHSVQNFTTYNDRFRMPSPESGGTASMWYSFNYGPVHFVLIDTETDFPGAPKDQYTGRNGGFGDQMTWLKADLAAAAAPEARKHRPWIIMAGHRPVYASHQSNKKTGAPTGDTAKLQKVMEPLMKQYGVDMYFSGHEHLYERTYPVYNNQPEVPQALGTYVNPVNTMFVITGNAGNAEANKQPLTGAKWLATGSGAYGMGTLEVVNRTTLHWTAFYSGRKGDKAAAGSVMDEVYLVKEHAGL